MLQVPFEALQCVISSLKYSSVNSFNEDVKTIREWMKGQPHLPEIMDDKKIGNFLLLNKGSVQKTKTKIDNYYTMRSRLPEIFEKINPKLPYLQHVLDATYCFPLPKLTKDMHRVFVFRTRDKRILLEKLNPIDKLRYVVNVQEIRLLEDVTYGDVFIVDGTDVPLTFLSKFSPLIVHKSLILIYKKVFSNRLKAVYVINASPFVDKLLAVLKLVLKPKLLDRIHICQSSDFLIERFGKEIIPRDYGGEEKSLQELQDVVREKFHQYEEYFDKLDELRVDEELRPDRLTDDDVLGFHGNFKKLEID